MEVDAAVVRRGGGDEGAGPGTTGSGKTRGVAVLYDVLLAGCIV